MLAQADIGHVARAETGGRKQAASRIERVNRVGRAATRNGRQIVISNGSLTHSQSGRARLWPRSRPFPSWTHSSVRPLFLSNVVVARASPAPRLLIRQGRPLRGLAKSDGPQSIQASLGAPLRCCLPLMHAPRYRRTCSHRVELPVGVIHAPGTHWAASTRSGRRLPLITSSESEPLRNAP